MYADSIKNINIGIFFTKSIYNKIIIYIYIYICIYIYIYIYIYITTIQTQSDSKDLRSIPEKYVL